ncbi:MAG TPA: GAF and ANTAR domain-containing protein [Acidimicrobiales bacterium]|nr:GAF and ANTAR domain-containing protein [Acidimicrobiales bacterium]
MTDTRSPLLRCLRELAQLSVLDHSLPEMLDRIVAIANDAVPPSEKVGLTLDVAGAVSTAAFTDDDVPEIEADQYGADAGPCLDAARHGLVFSVPSTATDDRYPEFSRSCAAHGIRSSLSTPVIARSSKRAALNFYATEADAFTPDDVDLAEAFAKHAAVAIENAEAYYSAKQLASQLGIALETRVVIEQAKGILIAQGRTGDDAFDVLRKASQRENRKLRDIAADLVGAAERRAGSRNGHGGALAPPAASSGP